MCSSDGQKGQKRVRECCKIIYMFPIETFKTKGEFSTHQARSMLLCRLGSKEMQASLDKLQPKLNTYFKSPRMQAIFFALSPK